MSRLRFLIFLIAMSVAPTGQAVLPIALNGEELPSLAPMLERVRPAIVNISTTTIIETREHPLLQDPFFRRFFESPRRQRPSSSLGSGVIVDAEKGYVITNHHVIDKADVITVTTVDGLELEAQLVGSDPASDVAVIRVDAENLTEIRLGDSRQLRVGDFVVAIGSPFGLSQTVTSGIVSALGRSGLGIKGYEDFIQTDASINPGNSGGALVNLRGELIGINTAILSRGGGSVGIGLSIPIYMVSSLMNQLVEFGEVKRGLLGVQMQDLTPALARAFGISGEKGAVVSEVISGSAAEEKGIREGDVIVGVDDTDIDSSADLRNAIGLLRPGDQARIEFYREGEKNEVMVRIKEFDEMMSNAPVFIEQLEGAHFKTVPPGADVGRGVVVIGIEPNSPAASSGLRAKDVIIGINQEGIADIKDMKRVVGKSHGVLLIKLIRNSRVLFLVIQ